MRQESELEKQKRLNRLALDTQGKFDGRHFQKDTVLNQMALLFAGEEGEKEAARILNDADQKFLTPLAMPEKKKYIEEEVNKRAAHIDKGLEQGFKDLFQSLTKQNAARGSDAEKDAIFKLLTDLGLNVDKDNITTHDHAGPPKMIVICWVNRPTPTLADENSSINKLANTYADNCDTNHANDFRSQWHEQQNHAKLGGPTVDKETFLAESKKMLEEWSQDMLAKPELNPVSDSPVNDTPQIRQSL